MAFEPLFLSALKLSINAFFLITILKGKWLNVTLLKRHCRSKTIPNYVLKDKMQQMSKIGNIE